MHEATLRKLHSFTGLFPLGAYLLFHAYEHFAVRAGRQLLVERLTRTSSAALELALVLVPLLLHAVLGLWLWRRPAGAAAYASARFRGLQLFTGLFTAAFVVFHVATAWLPRVRQGRAAAAYGALTEQVGQLPCALLYVLGTTCACLHFAQGLSAVLLRDGPATLSPVVVRSLCGLLGTLLWLTLMDELVVYAAGAPLL